jgi:hypothetical protein
MGVAEQEALNRRAAKNGARALKRRAAEESRGLAAELLKRAAGWQPRG